MAARTVCGSQPSRCPTSATEAPSRRSSRLISCARLVLAGGCSSALTRLVAKLARSATGLMDARAGSCLSSTLSLPLSRAFRAAGAVAAVGLVSADAARSRGRGLRLSGWRSVSAAGLFAAPGLIFALALLFARCLLVCWVGMASFSTSAPRPSRCLHHHKPGSGPGGRRPREEAVNTHSNARFAREVEWNSARR